MEFNCFGKKGKTLCSTVWHGVIWYLWKARNDKMFKGGEEMMDDTFDKIKYNMWTWVRNKQLVLPGYEFLDWEISPRGIFNLLTKG